jgi:hypothetical protein
MCPMSDELSARERGLMLGHTYASHQPDRVKLRRIATARNAKDVKASVDQTVCEPADLENAVAFWSGFAHGVTRFLVDQGAEIAGPADH